MLKKVSLVFFMILLSGLIITSQILVNQKPDTSNIPRNQWVASLVKPSVVRVVQGYSIRWSYAPPAEGEHEIDAVIEEYMNNIDWVTEIYTTGSGAIISSDGYIVTNAHVVDLAQTNDDDLVVEDLMYLAEELAPLFDADFETMYSYLEATLFADEMAKVLKVVLPSGEILDGEVKSYGAPVGEGIDVAVVKVNKKNLPSIRLGDYDNLNLQDEITIFGYPGAADSSLFTEESSLVVSITNGKISALDKKSTEGTPVLQVDAAATHGNSGGPITDENGTLIGLLTFRSENNPQEVQGFNFAVPVSTVKDFVDETSADNDPSDMDILYKEGLNLYWSGYYKEALVKFEEVKDIYPKHSDIKKFISDSKDKLSESKLLWSNYTDAIFIVDIVCGVLIFLLLLTLIILIVRGSRRRKAEALQASYMQTNMMNYNNINGWPQNNPNMNNQPQSYNSQNNPYNNPNNR
jgi:S1-C subfamily serine protease